MGLPVTYQQMDRESREAPARTVACAGLPMEAEMQLPADNRFVSPFKLYVPSEEGDDHDDHWVPESPARPQAPQPPDRPKALGLTVREAYEKYLLPDLQSGSPRNINEYKTAIKHWETLLTNPAAEATATGWDPDISLIDDELLSAFRAKLLARGLAPRTVNKTWHNIRAVLRRCSPRTSDNPAGKGMIPFVPYFAPLKASRPNPRAATPREVNALYRACEVATWPLQRRTGVAPMLIWQAALVCFWNLGPRCWDMWGMKPEKGWQWAKCDGRRIEYWQTKVKEWHQMPLNKTVQWHLERIRPAMLKRGGTRIFPASGNQHRLYDEWEKIRAEAAKLVPSVIDLMPHDLRRSCQTAFDDLSLGYGDYVVGHKPEGVGPTWYRDLSKRIPKAVRQLPQPLAFTELMPKKAAKPEPETTPDPRQKTLFD